MVRMTPASRLTLVATVLVATTFAPGCGSGKSPASPVATSCTFSVTIGTSGFGAAGGSGTATVSTVSGCAWTAASQADWIRVDGDTHTGSGSVSFTVAPSTQTEARTGSLVVAMQALSIGQDAADSPPEPCDVSLVADPDDFERDGGSGVLRIAVRAGCAWTLTQDAPWLTIEGPTQGTGSMTLKVSAPMNADSAARRITVAVGERTVVISQPGQGDCAFQVSPVGAWIPRIGRTDAVDVATNRGCRWTAASDVSWIHLDQTTGSGSAKLTYTVDYNPGGHDQSRRAPVAIRWQAPTAGQNVWLTQTGDCRIALALPGQGGLFGGTLTVGPDGGTFRFFVLIDLPPSACAWTVETSDRWVSVDFPRIGQVMGGDGDLHFTVPANTSAQPRQAVLLIGERPLTIVQQGRQ